MPDDPVKDNPQGTPAPNPSPDPAPASSGGLAGSSWKSLLPDGLKAEKSLASFSDDADGFSKFSQSYVNAQSMIGGSIRLPKADAKPEEQEAAYGEIYSKLGRPESPDKYDVKPPQNLPNGWEWNQELDGGFRAAAHKAGLNSKQLNLLYEAYAGYLGKITPNFDKQKEEGDASLREEFGAGADRVKARAQRLLKVMAEPELYDDIFKSGLANSPRMVKFLAKLAKDYEEDGVLVPDEPGKSVDDYKQEHTKLMKTEAYRKGDHAEHDVTVKRVNQLAQLIYS